MQLSPALIDSSQRLGQRFSAARPFRHLVIDDFFRPEFANALLAEFPAFERGNARTENGDLGQKSTVEKIRELGPSFEALDDLIQSKPFLDWLSEATGIPDLLYDPWYFGGGTHESREGQELDAHVDFNRHPANGWHRRLNLIVYLNREWEDAWGGSLELHSDPRRDDNRVTLVTPLFNRCVVFETTEWSWHGFSRITLPPAQAHKTRRSIALYFYSRSRPADELAPEHSTIYVERPLPERFRAGMTLGEQDVQELRVLLARRDQHIQRLYRDLMQQSASGSGAGAQHSLFSAMSLAGRSIARYLASAGKEDRKQALKQGLLPLARRLPASVREPGRRLWRRWV
ncbi:2OG-Fe(II) oxygenase [Pseudomarimonas salicorniae]|uniref:2OG-Fe(II) oxygenase n=1 Tax=Pseudomarimonas salicorniae TaxID=2933270 RepID=A0ABT0GH57_9GAMM|nr:2OG-Fe(II) oxygenase [Lysobacter sp. CAU 1642]MCK7593868.1 2OG-Fe(II) oxygenase [Lysobacter sp. CAU 1642]